MIVGGPFRPRWLLPVGRTPELVASRASVNRYSSPWLPAWL